MRPTDAHPELRQMLRVGRIIVLAIFAGLVLFLAFGYWRHHGEAPPDLPEQASYLTWVAIALGLTQPLIFLIVRWSLARQALEVWNRQDSAPFRGRYLTAVIVGAAGTEFGGLVSGVAYLVEGRDMALYAGAFCALVLLWMIPTRRHLDTLVESRP